MENKLIYEKSPYLLQHSHNPVNWYPWGEEAFRRAKEEGKPVFLSIGYSTCHWCHVMERESFEDEEIAKILNENYIAVKVDREERPDIDAVYMAVCQKITGHGGWPLTIIMTAEQKPFFAGTYFPKKTKARFRGLEEILLEIAEDWKEQREKIVSLSERVTSLMHQECRERVCGGEADKSILADALKIFANNFDQVYGGFGTAPKFPTPHNILFLMRYAWFEGDEACADMAWRTLEQMYRGGIYDHIGGGFSRYSTDDKWLVPHFEKMLYDNALLAYTYLEAYQMTKRSLFREVAQRTLDYVLRELTDGAGFCCGQDADSEGVEGKYYTFTEAEMKEVLGEEDGKEFAAWFGIRGTGKLGDAIPNLIENTEFETFNPRIAGMCSKLLDYRKGRMKLHRDDKILTSWNGLMIAALAKAYIVLGDAYYLSAAERAQTFLEEKLTEPDGRLRVRFRGGHVTGRGTLEDYAFTGFGLLELYRATFDVSYLERLLQISRFMVNLFGDEEGGGLYFYASDAEKLLTRPKEVYDGALPSGNSMAAYIFIQLEHLTGETVWAEQSSQQLKFLAGRIRDYPAGYSFSLLSMLEELYAYRDLVCTAQSMEEIEPLKEKLRESWCGNLAALVKTNGNKERIVTIAPFTTDYLIKEDGALYYLCQDGACMPPTDDLEKLELFS